MKRKKVLIISLSLVAILLFFVCMCAIAAPINLFDEFYYTYVSPDSVDTEFANVPSLSQNSFNAPSEEDVIGYKNIFGVDQGHDLYLIYDKNLEKTPYLRNNTRAYAVIDPEGKAVTWYCAVNCSEAMNDSINGNDEELNFVYRYDVKSKVFTICPIRVKSTAFGSRYESYDTEEYVNSFCELHNISHQDIDEYNHYFFDEVIVGMWIDGNRGFSKYTFNDLGVYRIRNELWSKVQE